MANEYGRQWADFFGLTVLSNTVFLGLIFLALYLFRDASARVKSIIGSIGILKLILPPFLPLSFASTPAALSVIPNLASSIVFTNSPASPTSGPAPVQNLDTAGFMFIACGLCKRRAHGSVV
jgi:hypothetical protein